VETKNLIYWFVLSIVAANHQRGLPLHSPCCRHALNLQPTSYILLSSYTHPILYLVFDWLVLYLLVNLELDDFYAKPLWDSYPMLMTILNHTSIASGWNIWHTYWKLILFFSNNLYSLYQMVFYHISSSKADARVSVHIRIEREPKNSVIWDMIIFSF